MSIAISEIPRLAGLVLLLSTASAGAVECHSVAGMLNGQLVTATRQATLSKSTLTLSGKMSGKSMPRRALPCVALAKGVLCERTFGPVVVTVMTNGKRMIETVTDPRTKRELASFAYVCSGAFRF